MNCCLLYSTNSPVQVKPIIEKPQRLFFINMTDGDGGLTVIDGSHLHIPDLHFPNPYGAVKGSQLLELCESEASSLLFGLSLPPAVKSAVLSKLHGNDGVLLSKEFNDGEFRDFVKGYFTILADELKDDPIVVSILDGCSLRVLLDDEDDFAMLAENLFMELDISNKGKLSKNVINDALIHMGIGLGVPPFPESRDLLENIMKRNGAEGDEQLGLSQFAELLQKVLQDLADALTKKHVTVIQNIKVINGSKLSKILADEKLLTTAVGDMFQVWDSTKAISENKSQLWAIIESKGVEYGFPPPDSNAAIHHLYDQIFTDIGEEYLAGNMDYDKFHKIFKRIFEMFEEQLNADPVFIDTQN